MLTVDSDSLHTRSPETARNVWPQSLWPNWPFVQCLFIVGKLFAVNGEKAGAQAEINR